MTEKRSRVFLGQLTERTGSYGKFLSGRIGMAQMIVSPSKDPAKVNVYLEETQQPEQAKPSQQGHHDRRADDNAREDDRIPF